MTATRKNTDRAAYRQMAAINDQLQAQADERAAELRNEIDEAGWDPDAAYERHLETRYEEDPRDLYEEAMDVGLSDMRAARQEREDARRELTLQTRCPAPLCGARAGEECGRGAAGTDRWDGLHQARWLIADELAR